MRRLLGTLTYAHIMSIVAIVLSTGGLAYAAQKLTTANVKDGSLTGIDVKDGTILSTDLSASAKLGMRGLTGVKGTTGTTGPPGAQGPTGPQGNQGTSYHAATSWAYNDAGLVVSDLTDTQPNQAFNTEVQQIVVNATGGTFTITFNAKTTAPIAYDATPAQVKSAMGAAVGMLADPDDVSVSGGPGSDATNPVPYSITYEGNLLGLNVPELTTDDSALTSATPSAIVTTTTPGGLGSNEVQDITVTGAGGTFTITFNSVTTAPIAYNAAASAVEAAMAAAPGMLTAPTDVAVTGGPGAIYNPTPYSVTFQGNLANTDVAAMTTNVSALAGGPHNTAVSTTVPGSLMNEVQQIVVTATGGTFTITFNGVTTAPIAYDAAPSAVESAMGSALGMLTAPTDVSVSGAPGTYSIAFDGNLRATDVASLTTNASALTGLAHTAVVSTTTAGQAPYPTDWDHLCYGALFDASPTVSNGCDVNEVQKIAVDATGGSYRVSYGGNTTSSIPATATASQLRTILGRLLDGVGDISVSGGPGNAGATTPYEIDFQGTLAATNVAPLTIASTTLTGGASTATATTTTTGGPVVLDPSLFEVQQITVSATNGFFTISFNGQTTAPIARNATAATVKAAMIAASGMFSDSNDVVVTGGPGTTSPFTMTFQGNLTGFNVPQMTTDATLLTGGAHTATVTTIADGAGAAVNEQQELTVSAIGGTFTISFKGATTDIIAYNATAAEVQAAMEADLLDYVGDATVIGGPGSNGVPLPYIIRFSGMLAGTNVPQITTDSTFLTGGTASVSTLVGGGPERSANVNIRRSGAQTLSLTGSMQTLVALTGTPTSFQPGQVKGQLGTISTDYDDVTSTSSNSNISATATISLMHHSIGETNEWFGGSLLHDRVICMLGFASLSDPANFSQMGTTEHASSTIDHQILTFTIAGNSANVTQGNYNVGVQCLDGDYASASQWSFVSANLNVLAAEQ